MKKKVLVSTIPFGEVSKEPIELLEANDIEIIRNPYGRIMTTEELIPLIRDADYFIAGLEQVTPHVLDEAKKLKIISRVGVGVDNIPFDETNKRGIQVTYTPDPTTQPVAELAVGLLIDCARRFSAIDRDIRTGLWPKYMGALIRGKTIGVIGLGRIGKTFVKLMKPFGAEILCNDLVIDEMFAREHGVSYVEKDELYKRSDFISLHLSFSESVRHLINAESLAKMKDGVCIINTSRGPVVREEDLCEALISGKVGGAALDVFEKEPYQGELQKISNVILTAHVGAATRESRRLMELGATEEVVRFQNGEPPSHPIDHI